MSEDRRADKTPIDALWDGLRQLFGHKIDRADGSGLTLDTAATGDGAWFTAPLGDGAQAIVLLRNFAFPAVGGAALTVAEVLDQPDALRSALFSGAANALKSAAPEGLAQVMGQFEQTDPQSASDFDYAFSVSLERGGSLTEATVYTDAAGLVALARLSGAGEGGWSDLAIPDAVAAHIPMEVSIETGTRTIPANRLATLEAGDVILFENAPLSTRRLCAGVMDIALTAQEDGQWAVTNVDTKDDNAQIDPAETVLSVRMGLAQMTLAELQTLTVGSTAQLGLPDISAGLSVRVLANDAPFADGRFIQIDDRYGVRIETLSRGADA